MKNGEQPAYAYDEEYVYHQNGQGVAYVTKSGGLTKREVFAGLAMQGMCAQFGHGKPEAYAKLAVDYADALLKELEK